MERCVHRDELARQRVQTINRLQRLLSELIPGQRKRNLSALRPEHCWPRSFHVTWPARPGARVSDEAISAVAK